MSKWKIGKDVDFRGGLQIGALVASIFGLIVGGGMMKVCGLTTLPAFCAMLFLGTVIGVSGLPEGGLRFLVGYALTFLPILGLSAAAFIFFPLLLWLVGILAGAALFTGLVLSFDQCLFGQHK